MKKSTKITILVAVLCCFAGLAVMTLSLFMMDFDFTKLSTQKSVENEYSFTVSFHSIRIDAKTADLCFLPSEDSTLRVVCKESEKVPHRVTIENGTLTIRADDQRNWYDYFGFDFSRDTVTIYLPKAQYDQLEAKTDTGNLQMPADFIFRSAVVNTDTGNIEWRASVEEALSVHTDTGYVTVDGMQVQSLQAETNTGSIRICQTSAKGKADLKTDTGDIKLEGVKAGSLQIRTHTGNVSLENTVAEGNLALKTDTGDVLFRGFDAVTITIETDTGDVTGTLLTEKVFITQTDTGSIDVPKTITGGRCEITTDTGDIEISIA